MDLNQIQKDVRAINTQIGNLGKEIQSAVDLGDETKLKEVSEQVRMMKKHLVGLKKESVQRMLKAREPDRAAPGGEDYSLTKMWGDQRYNPYWLKLAEYFGIKEKEYPIASSKISEILDWAANTAKSRKMSDVLYTVGKTMKKLSSAGYSERPYTILHRYIKLATEKGNLPPEGQKDVSREMSAYEK